MRGMPDHPPYLGYRQRRSSSIGREASQRLDCALSGGPHWLQPGTSAGCGVHWPGWQRLFWQTAVRRAPRRGSPRLEQCPGASGVGSGRQQPARVCIVRACAQRPVPSAQSPVPSSLEESLLSASRGWRAVADRGVGFGSCTASGWACNALQRAASPAPDLQASSPDPPPVARPSPARPAVVASDAAGPLAAGARCCTACRVLGHARRRRADRQLQKSLGLGAHGLDQSALASGPRRARPAILNNHTA
ncbi:uncharacterized protein BDZ99DRAFT_518464 [Mytilinidion resinicola]|uniref:Uncharacterized protein n=1 Tax=Mytilinidion resinicola TaxID=574789 RepID=A0A6A6YVR8_9PEZI|nr:uncharacterized protein BDZ99DRAFT_518464 [Mytilinidion resinicola]KAF2812648.1 hypothetical protein BDZ99DRAFT_518464 [Mytilinidion resinicola]